jgi:hypothetical protein
MCVQCCLALQRARYHLMFITGHCQCWNMWVWESEVVFPCDVHSVAMYPVQFNINFVYSINSMLSFRLLKKVCFEPWIVSPCSLQYHFADLKNDGCNIAGKGYLNIQLVNQREDFSFALFSGGFWQEEEKKYQHSVLNSLGDDDRRKKILTYVFIGLRERKY